MNARENIAPRVIEKATLIVAFIAALLCALGASVLFAWYNANAFGAYHNALIVMAYNTAICIILSGAALMALISKHLWAVKISAIVIGTLSGLTLLELMGYLSLDINFWFIDNPYSSGIAGLMSPTTAICLLLTSISLLLLGFFRNIFVIPIVFINLITLTITLIALLGYGVGLIPAFVWLGIKMAPHTAIGISLFALAVIIFIHQFAINAFNQLNFFNRIATGFGFMAVLVIAIGSIAFMQIHTVSAITHTLYGSPLQINNAAFQIKSEINLINRQLKNIAIRPESTARDNIPEQLNIAQQHIEQNLAFIRKNESGLNKELENLAIGFGIWKSYVLESYAMLERNEFESYSLRTVYGGQEQILALENILEKISIHAQQRITELNSSVENTEKEAKKLVIIIVLGFLMIGITVASLITRSLTSQLQKIRRAMLAISNENVNYPIPFLEHTQEIGDMARTLKIFQESFAARKELEARLRQVIETMPNGIIMINRLGIIEIVNAEAEKIFGYDRSDLLERSVEQIIPGNTAKDYINDQNSFFNSTSVATRELFGLHRDGKKIPIEVGLVSVDTKDGTKILASIVDITERHNATIALNESRERLELTTRINQIGIWEYIVDEGKMIWNDAMFDIHGRNKEYFTHDYAAWKQCIHPDDIENTEKSFNESLTNLTPLSCKFRIIQPDGGIKYLHAKAKVERQISNNQLRMLGTNIDVTREELALAKLHDLETLRSAIVEFSDDAIISKTPTGIVTSWNLGAQNMFGFSAEEAIGRQIKDLLFPADLMHQEDMLLSQVREGLEIKHFETVRLCKNGQLINVSITLSPIKDAAGNIIGISAIKRDITETIKTANMLSTRKLELEHANAELERSNKELETFAYVASHDLKSPLRGIAQLSTWIEEDLTANEYAAVIGHTQLLRNRIQRMEKLLDDLLIFYRAGKSEGELISVNVNQMVNEIFEIQNNKPGLRLELTNNLPILKTLSTPLELIIRNLFSNAIKHHDKEEGLIQVSSHIIDEQYIEFSVCDDGPGIPEKFHQRIFGMFQTLKPRDELEGSGMGLALIKKIVEGYGGHVTLKSEGRGACFSFTWPQTIRRRQEND